MGRRHRGPATGASTAPPERDTHRYPLDPTGRPYPGLTAAPAPQKVAPVSRTALAAADAAVIDVLDLALHVAEVLLASGSGSVDTVERAKAVAVAYGLSHCEVDVTFTSISATGYRGPGFAPLSSMVVVQHRSLNYTRLAGVHRLLRNAELGRLSIAQARAELTALTTAPHPYPRSVATLAWASMAAAVVFLVGGSALVAVIAFATTAVIDRTNRALNARALPFFFQQAVGGALATAPAVALYAARTELGILARPSEVVAACVVVLLSGLSLVGAVQDAITGACVTAAARMVEVLVLTSGIIVGLATTLKVARQAGIVLPEVGEVMPLLGDLPVQLAAAAVVSAAFALASYAEPRALAAAGAAGASGWGVYSLVAQTTAGPVMASALAAVLVGAVGATIARRTGIPALVVTVSGVSPMLPGGAVYRGLYALIEDQGGVGAALLGQALAIGAALAAGVVLGEWFAQPVRVSLGRLERRLLNTDRTARNRPRRVRWSSPRARTTPPGSVP